MVVAGIYALDGSLWCPGKGFTPRDMDPVGKCYLEMGTVDVGVGVASTSGHLAAALCGVFTTSA